MEATEERTADACGPAPHALFVRGSFRSKWKLHSVHPDRDQAVAASFTVRSPHVWVTAAPADDTTQTPVAPSEEPADA